MDSETVTHKHQFEELSKAVIGACIDVQRQLGLHCMEVDYQRALERALPKANLQFEREVEIGIYYDDALITKRRVDFLIWNDDSKLLLETKACSAILDDDIEQCLLYLTHGEYTLCLLINFGQRPLQIRRLIDTYKSIAVQANLSAAGERRWVTV